MFTVDVKQQHNSNNNHLVLVAKIQNLVSCKLLVLSFFLHYQLLKTRTNSLKRARERQKVKKNVVRRKEKET